MPSWEPPQGTLHFAAAIKNAREVDGFLVAPTPLFGYPELGNRILLRECYPLLCSRLQQVHAEESWTSFVISGQEGVGKTYWLMWLLTRWASCVYRRLPGSLIAALQSNMPPPVLS